MTMPIIYPVLASRANSVSNPCPPPLPLPSEGLELLWTHRVGRAGMPWSSSLLRKPFSVHLTPPSCFLAKQNFRSST